MMIVRKIRWIAALVFCTSLAASAATNGNLSANDVARTFVDALQHQHYKQAAAMFAPGSMGNITSTERTLKRIDNSLGGFSSMHPIAAFPDGKSVKVEVSAQPRAALNGQEFVQLRYASTAADGQPVFYELNLTTAGASPQILSFGLHLPATDAQSSQRANQLSSALSGGTPPPAIPFSSFPENAALQSSPFSELMMGGLRVILEQTTLDDIRTAVSAGVIAHQGDAGASVYWLCYTNLSSAPAERIWMLADGEMGGDGHRITGVSAQRLSGAEATADCPALPAKLTPIRLATGIWLDTLPQLARTKLGKFSLKRENWESYGYAGKAPGKCAGGHLDLTSFLMLQVERDRIQSLRINKITSC